MGKTFQSEDLGKDPKTRTSLLFWRSKKPMCPEHYGWCNVILNHVRIYIIYPLIKSTIEMKFNSRMEQKHLRLKTAILRRLDLTQNTVRIPQNFITKERCDLFFLTLFCDCVDNISKVEEN